MMLPKSSKYFLYFVLVLSVMVLGSILLARYQRHDGKGLYESASELSQHKYRKPHTSDKDYYNVDEKEIKLYPFDPNEATRDQLLQLGLAPFQVRSILRYRAKGGCFSTKEDFKRVYRLTNQQWQRLQPLIRIGKKYQLVNPQGFASAGSKRFQQVTGGSKRFQEVTGGRDSIRATYPKKLSGNQTININTADSATLCKVPGIGGYYARQIISYRNRLGGYVSERQLLEIKDFPADALSWMEAQGTIHKLDVNHLGERKMSKHPYMGFYRANEIASYRKVHGPLKSIETLQNLPHFTQTDIQRLEPYLDFK